MDYTTVERLINTLGLPALIIVGVGWFFATRLFPWWAHRQEHVMRELISAIQALREESRASAEALRALAERVERIERVLGASGSGDAPRGRRRTR